MGRVFWPEKFAVKPNVVVPSGATLPLYAALVTVTDDPLPLSVPFHTWLMVWPLGQSSSRSTRCTCGCCGS